MPKLQKHLAYKYKDKDHYKHVIVVPEEVVDKLGWKEGDEIRHKVEGDALVLRTQLEESVQKIANNTGQYPVTTKKINMKKR